MSLFGVSYSTESAQHEYTDTLRTFANSSTASSIRVANIGTYDFTKARSASISYFLKFITMFPQLRCISISRERGVLHDKIWPPSPGGGSPLADSDFRSQCRVLVAVSVSHASIAMLLGRTPELEDLTLEQPVSDGWTRQSDALYLPRLQRLEIYEEICSEDCDSLSEAVIQACVRSLRRLFVLANTPNLATLLSTIESNRIILLALEFRLNTRPSNSGESVADISSAIVHACPRLRHLALHFIKSTNALVRIFDAVQSPLASLDLSVMIRRPYRTILGPLVAAMHDNNDETHYALTRLRVLAVKVEHGDINVLKPICAARRVHLIQYDVDRPLLWQHV